MTPRRYTVLLPRVLDLRRSFAFNRRPGDRNNRGRVQSKIQPSGAPPPDVTPPVFLAGIILASGTQLALNYNEGLDAGSVPLPAAYSLAGTPQVVTGVAVAAGVVLLTLSGPVLAGAVVTLTYTAGVPPVQDLAGNDAANLVNAPVTNNSTFDGTAPLLVSATIPSSGLGLTLVYNEALDAGSVPAPGAYALAGTAAVVTAVSVVGTSVILTLSPAVLAGEIVTLTYTAGGAPVQDLAGNDAANLAGQAVTNNSTAGGGDVTAPTLVSAAINAAGTSLVLTYNEALDAGSVPAPGAYALAGTLLAAITGVGVAGSAVTLTLAPAVALDEVGLTVSYTAGGAPVQDAAGNDAANLAGQPVTNNSTHAFVPSDVPGLVGWFDMQDASSYTEAAGVLTSITNKASGAVWNTGTLPAVSATAIGGALPGMDFNGTTQSVSSTEAAVVAAMADALALTAFIVLQPDNADRTERFFCAASATQALNRTKHFGKSSTGAGSYVTGAVSNTGVVASAVSVGVPLTTPQVFETFASVTQDSMRLNGAAADPNLAAFAPGVTTPDRIAIGCRPASTLADFFDGKIGEILLYTVNLAAAIRSRLRVYLGPKWSIAVTPG
jgi:uncharacterized repeat protein (TIGR02059 family)